MSEKLLEIQDLEVLYKTDDAVVYAVNGIDLAMVAGETLGLVGETGAGKTTTALSIMRLLPAGVGEVVKGSIKLDGIDILNTDEKTMRSIRGDVVSMIFQDPMTSLNPVLTVEEQLAEVLELHDKAKTKQELAEKVDEIMEMVGIPATRKVEYPHQFSGGMKQRIVIAIALACEPKLILADEPTTALDVTIQAQVLELMKELKDRLNTSMLLITHDMGVVAESCDRVAIMYAGEVIEIGTAEDIFNGEKRHPYTDGLFHSIPNLKRNERRLNPIKGLMPDPTNLPGGCKFHDRCDFCMEVCKSEAPPKAQWGTHAVRCHLYAPGAREGGQ